MKNKDYRDYFQDILDSVNEIDAFVKGMTFADFTKDKKTINAVVRSIEVIGEAAKNIPPATRIKYPDIPWKKMAGMRDKLIHEYFGIDLGIIWQTTKTDIPMLKQPIANIIEKL